MLNSKSCRLYVSTGCVGNLPLKVFLEECANKDIWNIELSSGVIYEPGLSKIIEKEQRQFNFLVHNYFPPPQYPFTLNLAASDEVILIRSLEHCRRAIDLCAKLGVPFYSVHSGFCASIKPESLGKSLEYDDVIPRDRAFAIFVNSIRSLVVYARSKRVRLLIEPNVVEKCNIVNGRNELMLICDAEEIVYLAGCVDDAAFGILLDTGHLNVTAHVLNFDRKAFIETIAPYVRACHLHDNDGCADTHQPVKPDSWIFDILPKQMFIELPVIVEAKFRNINDMDEHVKWLKGCLYNDCSN